jgi:hypothetical protein
MKPARTSPIGEVRTGVDVSSDVHVRGNRALSLRPLGAIESESLSCGALNHDYKS